MDRAGRLRRLRPPFDRRPPRAARPRRAGSAVAARGPDRTDPEETDTDYWTEPAGSGGFGRLSTDDLRGLLDRVGLAVLSLLAVVAGWGFYSQSGNAIRTWFDPAYQSVALAVFNLAVLLVALAGVAHQLRRIRSAESGGSE
ncbi:hypothetical protein [Halorubrum ezzemoulense]|uniref:hypothetical protein n=1 Tax=Halorubrum ezzemoulense TaxID=337243 RepID=UPI003743B849